MLLLLAKSLFCKYIYLYLYHFHSSMSDDCVSFGLHTDDTMRSQNTS